MNEQQPPPPPMDPETDEADERQLDLARRQGDAYGEAVDHMVEQNTLFNSHQLGRLRNGPTRRHANQCRSHPTPRLINQGRELVAN